MLIDALVIIVVLAAVAVIAKFLLLCLRDLAAADDSQISLLSRNGWFVVIVLAIPIGGLAYLFYGRQR